MLQGVERMTLQEVNDKVGQDFDVCEVFLAEGPYLAGDSPSLADCFLFALLDLVRPCSFPAHCCCHQCTLAQPSKQSSGILPLLMSFISCLVLD